MTRPRVTYFDFAGSRGEEVRLALVLAGVEFEDVRISREDLAGLKPRLPFPHVPTFEMEGRPVLGQTNAILRLIGRLHGLYPEDPYQAARHDEIMEAVEDLRARVTATLRMADPERRDTRTKLAQDFMPQWGRAIDDLIGDGPFAGGERPGVADLKVYMMDTSIVSGRFDDIPPDIFDPYPRLKAASAGVAVAPEVVAWNARTPK